MVLAAGRGTRLGRLGMTIPKVLVDIAGQPLLSRQLDYLSDAGAQRIVVNAHHLSEAIEEFAAAYRGPAELRVVVEPELLGTAGGVRNALGELGPAPFAVLYGDVLIDEPLDAVFETHRDAGADATITVYRAERMPGKGFVDIDDAGRVIRFEEKADGDGGGTALINAGLYVIDPRRLESWPVSEFDFGFDYFPALLADGATIAAHHVAPVIDVGTPEGLQAGRDLFNVDAG